MSTVTALLRLVEVHHLSNTFNIYIHHTSYMMCVSMRICVGFIFWLGICGLIRNNEQFLVVLCGFNSGRISKNRKKRGIWQIRCGQGGTRAITYFVLPPWNMDGATDNGICTRNTIFMFFLLCSRCSSNPNIPGDSMKNRLALCSFK